MDSKPFHASTSAYRHIYWYVIVYGKQRTGAPCKDAPAHAVLRDTGYYPCFMVLEIAVAIPKAALVLAISPPFPLASAAAEAMPDEASIIASITATDNITASLLRIALPPVIWWYEVLWLPFEFACP